MKFKKLLIIIAVMLMALYVFGIDLPVSSNDIQFITVSVTGAVTNPGVYKLNIDSRLSDAIKKANYTAKTPQQIILANPPAEENTPQPTEDNNKVSFSKRDITIYRGQNKIKADLLKFYKLGDLKNNPNLKDGDIIFVPAAKNFVNISGEINSPGQYEIIQNEKLTDIIELAMGLKNSAFLDSINIYRYENNAKLKKITVNLKNNQDIALQDGDRIFIRAIPDFHSDYQVSVDGEVRFAGDYPLEKGRTTLLEILNRAGGITQYADLDNAILIRITTDNNLISDTEFQRLKTLPIADMTYQEYEYFKAKSRLIDGLVDVNFKKLWQTKNEKYDVVLKNGDKIYIPNKYLTVEILGQVKNPGKYTYIKGKNYLYYIELAGGFASRPNKKKIRIIKHKSATWLKPNETKIEPGDKIFIPEKPRYDYVKITKDILQILTGAATLYFMRNSFK